MVAAGLSFQFAHRRIYLSAREMIRTYVNSEIQKIEDVIMDYEYYVVSGDTAFLDELYG